ncbi:MAG: fatty acid desaturase [Myxococcota bacterium]
MTINVAPMASEAENSRDLRAFGEEIDAVRARFEAQFGAPDVAYIKRVARFSRVMEVLGRGLIHFSFEPITFGLGVLSLAIHKQLHGAEVGHTVLHGAFDKLPDAEGYRSKDYWWETPIDERSWHAGHNIRHHQYTNVAGKDPDCRYGTVRLNHHVEHRPENNHQELHPLFIWPSFTFNMAMHFSGMIDLYTRKPGEYDVIEDRSWATIKQTHRRALRKAVPYYAKEYVLFPLLAGPMFWKVILGNWMAEVLRSVYSAATIFCGHVGEDVNAYASQTKARGRAQWYAMQVEAANNFEVPLPISILCGTLDRQIEHHLFPKWPTNRLREVSPEIRAICERHGVRYRTASWGTVLRGVFRQLRALGRPTLAQS